MGTEEIKNLPVLGVSINDADEVEEKFNPNWASDAPRGGRAVLTRILKESATVPLFFAQTLVQSLRDVGYNTTTSALCGMVTMPSDENNPVTCSANGDLRKASWGGSRAGYLRIGFPITAQSRRYPRITSRI